FVLRAMLHWPPPFLTGLALRTSIGAGVGVVVVALTLSCARRVSSWSCDKIVLGFSCLMELAGVRSVCIAAYSQSPPTTTKTTKRVAIASHLRRLGEIWRGPGSLDAICGRSRPQ